MINEAISDPVHQPRHGQATSRHGDASKHGRTSASEDGPAPLRILVGYGFWIFLLSDSVMFAAIFASYAVLSGQTAGGPTGAELFELPRVAIQTACLLASSFTCGLIGLAEHARSRLGLYGAAAITFVLGATFLGLELSEFAGMIGRGAGPSTSAFLSAFFLLVGTHGVHVSIGLLWLLVMALQVATLGFSNQVRRRLYCFTLFWHTLDIIWVALFTVVYLMGTR